MAGVGSNIRKTARKIYRNVRWAPAARQIFDVVALKRRDHLLDKAYPDLYRKYSTRPVNPKKVIFVENNSREISDSFTAILDDLKKDGSYTVHVHFLEELTAGREGFSYNCARLAADAATAAYIFLNDYSNVISCLPLREETKVIQLWHACGCYKKFGYDAKDDIPPDYHGANVYRNADLVTVSGEAAVRAFASAMRLPESCVRPLGVSRTDLYFREKWIERCRKRFYEQYPDACSKKVVLWAPTFRGNAGMPELVALDLEKLQCELGEDYMVLARLHPHMKKVGIIADGRRRSEAEVSTSGQVESDRKHGYIVEISTEELYPVVDVLIADYSSLIYEYLLFRKPLVLYVPDLEDYRARRGFYMEPEEIPARIVMKEQALAAAVREAAEDAAGWAGKHMADKKTEPRTDQEHFLEAYMGACDGKVTDRIVEWMTTLPS